jgi:TPR repeat protein
MNSRSCRWLIVSALVITTSGAWAQQSAPPASDQTLTTGQLSETPKAAKCSLPPTFAQQSIAALEQQAASGDAAAQCGLGIMYAHGHGVPQDYTQAAAWYRKAAEQGVADAQDILGYLYCNGQGVPQDYAQAAAWYRKAAEQGVADAQDILGYLYCNGQGVPQDYAQAAAWWRKAAEQGDADAQYNLGGLYDAVGHGVPQDYAEAYFWLDLVAAGKLDAPDTEKGAKFRDESASHLAPADLSREQERARKWFEAHQSKPQ